MKILVVGAGIGGLTAAGLLHQRGHDVELIEKASAFGEVGAGIQVSPNGGRIIAELGLADELAAVGTRPERVVLRRWEDDAELLVRPLGEALQRRYGIAYYNVYRPDLINVLATSVADLPIRLNTSVVGAGNDHDTAFVELTGGERLNAGVVIGADGINSVVGRSLFGDHPTRFTGWVAYRALVPRSAVPDLPIEVVNRLGPMAHLVSYFVGEHQRYLNLVCVVHEPDWDVESWTERGDLTTLRTYFEDWSSELQVILDNVEEPVFKWALRDRTPLDRWTDGRVALLGDSCHPMVPFMAQGACQAIEDAAVLARCLDLAGASSDPTAALSVYQSTRRPRASDLQARSFDNATVYHHPDGEDQRVRDEFFAAINAAPGDGLERMDPIYGYDPLTVELTRP